MERRDEKNGAGEPVAMKRCAEFPRRSAVDETVRSQILKNWDDIAMPLDGMGAFRTLTAQIGGILGDPGLSIGKKAVLVMCADNGIVAEGVSQTGQDVTRIVAESMGRGESTVCRMAQQIGADVIPVDVGMARAGQEESPGQDPAFGTGLLHRNIRPGSRDFLREPALTEGELEQAFMVGIDLVRECKERGYRLLGTGEMGIGNTTTSSAVAAALLKEDVRTMTGRGAGLSDAGYEKKCRVIAGAAEKYRLSDADVCTVLCCVGGYDIAALAGVFLGGHLYRMPIVLDGVISMTAALAAVRLCPAVRDCLIPSHMSREPAAERLAEELGITPVIFGDMALGEGTGAVMMMSLLDLAVSVYHGVRSFGDSKITPYRRFDADGG